MPSATVDALREQLGLPDAPLVNDGLETTCRYFEEQLRQDPQAWVAYLRGIDFHKPVRIEWLRRGMRLIRYESTGDRMLKPFSYYTSVGTSPTSTGTTFPSVEFKTFEVVRSVPALVSTASGISFGVYHDTVSNTRRYDRVSRLGGGAQYIIGFSDAPVLVRTGARRT